MNSTKIFPDYFCCMHFFLLLLQIEDIKNILKLDIMNLGTGEIIIIALVVLLLFGGKKIPELMKGLGKGVRNFKEGVNGIEDTINNIDKPMNTEKKEEEK